MQILSRAKLWRLHFRQIACGFFISAVFLFLVPFSGQAAEPPIIVINEIAWMGTETEAVESKNWWRYEWLELFNNTNKEILLEGWKIGLYGTSLEWSFTLRGIILPQSYFLMVSSDKIFRDYDFNYSSLSGNLNNNGKRILLEGPNGIVDEIDCSGGWFAGNNETKQTMERKSPLASGNNILNWQTSQAPGGTPKAKNSSVIVGENASQNESNLKTNPNCSQKIIFNEILPSPSGSDDKEEWIEIYNPNGSEVDLSGWTVGDISGATSTYLIPGETKISPLGFLVLSRPETKIVLNNNEDGLNLLCERKIIDTVSYKTTEVGQSYNLTESGWMWISILTPGEKNAALGILKNTVEKDGLILSEEKNDNSMSSPVFPLTALFLAIISGFAVLFLKSLILKKI